MIWRCLTTVFWTIKTECMVEMERNPVVLRQGAAALACIAAAAAVMPIVAERAAEQRAQADDSGFAIDYARRLEARLVSRGEEATQMALAALRDGQGARAQGAAVLEGGLEGREALVLQASLRPGAGAGPFESSGAVYERELRCLSEAIYYEARGETRAGQIAVAEVVMNRVRSRAYPGSICGVVYQGSHRVTGCQFTFTCDGSAQKRPRGRPWREAREIAADMIAGDLSPVTNRATHYHTTAVSPVWAPRLVETGRIGAHIFYRYPTPAERAVMPAWSQPRSAPPQAELIAALASEDPLGAGQAALEAEAADAGPREAPERVDAPGATEAGETPAGLADQGGLAVQGVSAVRGAPSAGPVAARTGALPSLSAGGAVSAVDTSS